MSKKNLVEMIEIMIRFNGEAEQVLLDYCQGHVQDESKNLVIENQLRKHWSKAEHIIEFANTYAGCGVDDEEIVYDENEGL